MRTDLNILRAESPGPRDYRSKRITMQTLDEGKGEPKVRRNLPGQFLHDTLNPDGQSIYEIAVRFGAIQRVDKPCRAIVHSDLLEVIDRRACL